MSERNYFYVERIEGGSPAAVHLDIVFPTRRLRMRALALFSSEEQAQKFIREEAERLRKNPEELGAHVRSLTDDQFLSHLADGIKQGIQDYWLDISPSKLGVGSMSGADLHKYLVSSWTHFDGTSVEGNWSSK